MNEEPKPVSYQITKGFITRPTMNFRWRMQGPTTTQGAVLEQAHQEHGGPRVVWVAVPFVYPEKNNPLAHHPMEPNRAIG